MYIGTWPTAKKTTMSNARTIAFGLNRTIELLFAISAALVVVEAASAEALAAIVHRLPYHGSKSFLVLDDSKMIAQGVWPADAHPLRIEFPWGADPWIESSRAPNCGAPTSAWRRQADLHV